MKGLNCPYCMFSTIYCRKTGVAHNFDYVLERIIEKLVFASTSNGAKASAVLLQPDRDCKRKRPKPI